MVTIEVIEEPESYATVQCSPVQYEQSRDGVKNAAGATDSGANSNIIPVTPLVVGKVASQDDAFYTPHRSNPFATKFKDCNKKIMGHESWASSSLLELPSPVSPFTPPCTPITPGEETWLRPLRPRLKRSQSLPNSPLFGRKDVDRSVGEPQVYLYPRARRTFSVAPVLRSRTETDTDSGDQDSLDARSDGGSSNDSAVDLRMRHSDVTAARLTFRFGYRKYSVDHALLNTSWDGRPPQSRTELMARCMEARLAGHDWAASPHRRFLHDRHLLIPDDRDDLMCTVPRSYSSSESFMSLDESAIMSPTSSMSSYSEDAEFFYTRNQMEFYESKLRSRERFQELVRRWESKQAQGQQGQSAAQGQGAGQAVVPAVTADFVSGEGSKKLAAPAAVSGANAGADSNSKQTAVLLIGIKERGEPPGDPRSEKKFQELRKRWESKEQTVVPGGEETPKLGASGGSFGDAFCSNLLATVEKRNPRKSTIKK